jgi:hypothetical protein
MGRRGDWAAVVSECRRCQRQGTVISDGCARTIAAMYGEGLLSISFEVTGAVPEDASALWAELFPAFARLPTPAQTVANMMNTYLANHAGRGPVDGWLDKWVGKE